MTPNDYQRRALATALPAALDASYLTLGLCGEAGEVAELLKKSIRDGEKADHADRLRRELGDVLWYVAVLAHVHGLTLEEVMQANLDKLSARKATGNLGGSGDYRGEAGGFGSTGTGPAFAPAFAPVTLTRRSPDAARAYHEGYAAGLSSMAGWLRDKADASEAMAATLGAGAELPADGGSDDDRARLEARVRALEAAVSEARAEAAQWAAELDGERAAVVAWLRSQVSQAAAAVCLAYDHAASAIAAGEHRAGGAR